MFTQNLYTDFLSISPNNQTMGTTHVHVGEWISKAWYIYTLEFYSALKKE